jgi:uncharacterized protein (DUF1499 family)
MKAFRTLALQILAVVAIASGIWAWNAWPRLSEIETGRTPEYPDLQPHDYGASPEAVAKAAKTVLARLPGWSFVGEGKGPAGAEIQAVHQSILFLLKEDVTIRVRREKGRSVVSVRSRSRIGSLDFGLKARNVRELLDALDHEVF